MNPLLTELQGQPELAVAAGDLIIRQDDQTGRLFVLIDGTVEVRKDGVSVTKVSDAGAVFGELSALLETPHTAEVRALAPSRFYVVDDARAFLQAHPSATWQMCTLLARRLDAVNKYLVDLKQQFAGHDHLGMVDGMLDMLMHRQPRQRVRPPRTTLADPEIAD